MRSIVGTTKQWFKSIVDARPAPLGNPDSVVTAFDGDQSSCSFPIEHRILDDALGAPTSGYLGTPETAAIRTYTYVESGHNQATDAPDGRTGAATHFASLTHVGQGDAAILHGSVFVAGEKPGSTNFLANPSGIIVNGQVLAGSNGVYLNPCEWLLQDNGYDVAAVGFVANMKRTNSTGAKSAFWNGVRIQSTGTSGIESAYFCSGPFKVGADFTKATFTGPALALKAGQRIALNCTPGTYNVAGYGTEWIEYDAASGVIRFVCGNTAALQVSPVQVTAAQNLAIAAGYKLRISGQPVVGPRVTGWSLPSGVSSRASFDTSSVTVQELAKRLKALLEDLHASGTGNHGLIG